MEGHSEFILFDKKDQIMVLLSVYEAPRWWVKENNTLIRQGGPNFKDRGISKVAGEKMKKKK